jgi:hypothetical protein
MLLDSEREWLDKVPIHSEGQRIQRSPFRARFEHLGLKADLSTAPCHLEIGQGGTPVHASR